ILFFFFFFQAEDGIRDFHVTGVQTCALPIFNIKVAEPLREAAGHRALPGPRRPVDGHLEPFHRAPSPLASSRSTRGKPGKDTLMHPASSTVTPSSEPRPPTARAIARRWSPRLRAVPPRTRRPPATRKPASTP